MQNKDQVYVEALLINDNVKINEIYRNFAPKIIAYVIKNSGSTGEAKDLFQDALISIYNKALTQDFVLRCPFEAYLFMVCRSKWLNILKSSRKKKETILKDDGYTNEEAFYLAEETIQYEKKMELLESKFEYLGESCQKILKLSWKGTHLEKVAQQLDISYAYVRKKKSECIARLIQLVKKDESYTKLKAI